MTFPTLVTHSGKPDAHFMREGAIALCAADTLLCHDSHSVENAVEWSRALFDKYEFSEHDGDCTNQPQTCARCLVDGFKDQAEREHDE